MAKGIFCLEGNWFGRGDRTTVEPVLHLLEKMWHLKVPYLRYDVATRKEFKFCLKEWQNSPSKHTQSFTLVFTEKRTRYALQKTRFYSTISKNV